MAPRRRGGRGKQQVQEAPTAPPVRASTGSFDSLQINGCKDDVVGPIIRGSYTLEEKNHDRPVFRKDETVGSKALDVMLYFWEDKESPDFSGWWFGPQIGGDEVWAFHPDTSAKTPPTSGWQCPFDGPVDSSIEIVPKLVKGAQTPGRQPGTARKEIVPVLTTAEKEARRMKELELMKQHEEISIRLQEEREKLAIQRQADFERRKQLEAERKQREHHVQLLLRRALQKLRLAKPETFGDLLEEVDHLLQAEAEYLSRPLRLEAEKVKADAKSRVLKINQFNQKIDQKKKQEEESQRQHQEANKKIIEQLEQLVEAVEFSAETLEVKMNSIQGEGLDTPTDQELDAFSEAVVMAEKDVETAYRSCTTFVRENNEAIEEVEDHEGKPGKEVLQQLLKRANVANAKRSMTSGGIAAIREAAVQRHAAAVEALERKSLAEALLEREKAIFKRYDAEGDDRLTVADAIHYARGEFGFEASPKDLERLFQQLGERFDKSCAESLPFERFHDLKVAVGIAREIARDQQQQASKQDRVTVLGYAIGETEALFDKAEAACYEAKEEADRLPQLHSSGATSSEMAEACRKVMESIKAAEEELETAKKEAEELKKGDASGVLDDHRTASVRLLSRFMKPKQQLNSAKFVLTHWEKQISVTRAAEVQDFGKTAKAALRAASPKAQGIGTELLEGLGDPEGDPFDKDDVASFLRLKMPDAPEDLVSSWLDFVTQNNEYKEILTREELWILIRVCYKVVNSTVLTTDVSVMESTSLATLEVGEVLELIGDETLEATEELDLHRIRARRLKDGQEGWVTVRGNAQSVFLQLGGDRLAVVKETSLTESVSISGQDVLRPLRVGELLDIMGEESMDEVSGLRARVRAQSDGQVGWATKVGSTGAVFLRQL